MEHNPDNLENYLREIEKIPLLSSEEEKELIKLARQGSRPDGIKKVVEANLSLVVLVARKYEDQKIGLSDLITAGNAGLFRAAQKYDPDKDYKFSTYATWWVKEAMEAEIENAKQDHDR